MSQTLFRFPKHLQMRSKQDRRDYVVGAWNKLRAKCRDQDDEEELDELVRVNPRLQSRQSDEGFKFLNIPTFMWCEIEIGHSDSTRVLMEKPHGLEPSMFITWSPVFEVTTSSRIYRPMISKCGRCRGRTRWNLEFHNPFGITFGNILTHPGAEGHDHVSYHLIGPDRHELKRHININSRGYVHSKKSCLKQYNDTTSDLRIQVLRIRIKLATIAHHDDV